MLNLERACSVQMAIQGSGQTTYPLSADVCELTAKQYEAGDANRRPGMPDSYAREWTAMLQRLEPAAPTSFRD